MQTRRDVAVPGTSAGEVADPETIAPVAKAWIPSAGETVAAKDGSFSTDKPTLPVASTM